MLSISIYIVSGHRAVPIMCESNMFLFINIIYEIAQYLRSSELLLSVIFSGSLLLCTGAKRVVRCRQQPRRGCTESAESQTRGNPPCSGRQN